MPRRRVRRPSKWRNPTEPQPRFTEGERVRNVVVERYMGHSRNVPGQAKLLSGEHHWYECRCDCSDKILRTQQQLIDERRYACGCIEPKEITNANHVE
jgi:hypothetical protein